MQSGPRADHPHPCKILIYQFWGQLGCLKLAGAGQMHEYGFHRILFCLKAEPRSARTGSARSPAAPQHQQQSDEGLSALPTRQTHNWEALKHGGVTGHFLRYNCLWSFARGKQKTTLNPLTNHTQEGQLNNPPPRQFPQQGANFISLRRATICRSGRAEYSAKVPRLSLIVTAISWCFSGGTVTDKARLNLASSPLLHKLWRRRRPPQPGRRLEATEGHGRCPCPSPSGGRWAGRGGRGGQRGCLGAGRAKGARGSDPLPSGGGSCSPRGGEGSPGLREPVPGRSPPEGSGFPPEGGGAGGRQHSRASRRR